MTSEETRSKTFEDALRAAFEAGIEYAQKWEERGHGFPIPTYYRNHTFRNFQGEWSGLTKAHDISPDRTREPHRLSRSVESSVEEVRSTRPIRVEFGKPRPAFGDDAS